MIQSTYPYENTILLHLGFGLRLKTKTIPNFLTLTKPKSA